MKNHNLKKVGIIIAICMALLFNANNSYAQTIVNKSVEDFQKGITLQNVQLLDVRTASEYQSGHLKKALQANWNNETEFKERTKALDKSKPVYVYCLSGVRSSAAANWLSENGFKNVVSMKGGINAWKQANKSVEGQSKIKQMTFKEFTAMIPKDKTVVVDFSAVWCAPCQKMKPIVKKLKNEKYQIIEIDGGSQSTLCKTLKIDAFPTFIIYKNGKETTRKQGIQTEENLKKLFL